MRSTGSFRSTEGLQKPTNSSLSLSVIPAISSQISFILSEISIENSANPESYQKSCLQRLLKEIDPYLNPNIYDQVLLQLVAGASDQELLTTAPSKKNGLRINSELAKQIKNFLYHDPSIYRKFYKTDDKLAQELALFNFGVNQINKNSFNALCTIALFARSEYLEEHALDKLTKANDFDLLSPFQKIKLLAVCELVLKRSLPNLKNHNLAKLAAKWIDLAIQTEKYLLTIYPTNLSLLIPNTRKINLILSNYFSEPQKSFPTIKLKAKLFRPASLIAKSIDADNEMLPQLNCLFSGQIIKTKFTASTTRNLMNTWCEFPKLIELALKLEKNDRRILLLNLAPYYFPGADIVFELIEDKALCKLTTAKVLLRKAMEYWLSDQRATSNYKSYGYLKNYFDLKVSIRNYMRDHKLPMEVLNILLLEIKNPPNQQSLIDCLLLLKETTDVLDPFQCLAVLAVAKIHLHLINKDKRINARQKAIRKIWTDICGEINYRLKL